MTLAHPRGRTSRLQFAAIPADTPPMGDEPEQELRPGEEWKRRPGVARQGARFGAIGCGGCATFVVLAIVASVVALMLIGLLAQHS